MVRINVNRCSVGAYIRYYMNGWHYWNFNPFESEKESNVKGTQVLERFSPISRIEQSTGKEVKTFYVLGAQSIKGEMFEGLKGLLYAEVTQLYYNGRWADMKVNRESFVIRQNSQNAYDVVCKAELLNVGDIDWGLILPNEIFGDDPIIDEQDISVSARTIYDEKFESAYPFSFTEAKTTDNVGSQATIEGDETLKVLLKADPIGINNSYLILTYELPSYLTNYGAIKVTIDGSFISNLANLYYTNNGTFRQINLNIAVSDDTTALNYEAGKKIVSRTDVILSTAPLRYIRLYFNNSALAVGSAKDVNAYLDRIKIEVL
jgi:hypothetical protein